ncbi:MAG: hypothetical protein ACI9MR_004557, partial [Myxococcota bacterium]
LEDTWGADVGPQGPVVVAKPHWRTQFFDDFRGKTGAPSDDYCFDVLKPQCHVWPGGNSHRCDQTDVNGELFPPMGANMAASIALMDPSEETTGLSEAEIQALYGDLIEARLANLNKCNWTMYEMVNWMSTDYAGHWAAKFDASQVEVDTRGKGYLKLSATRAHVQANCIYGGVGGDPNCQVQSFADGVLSPAVTYWVDPNPAYPGVYYARIDGGCPYGGSVGVNCLVYSFPPNFLEATDVSYWADPDPRWPGVYYANATYRCKENIDYTPSLGFRGLACPVLNGGVMSRTFDNHPWVDGDGAEHMRGFMQQNGRFEAKVRIPAGTGSFPAAWLMPESGGWPYDGGEIDVMESRDPGHHVFQTYHTGKCYNPANNQQVVASGNADCKSQGYETAHMSKGYITDEREAGEFRDRDHVFAVEWVGDQITWFINDKLTGSIAVGTEANVTAGTLPAGLNVLDAGNFPFRPFYWILNHSTYVPDDKLDGFSQQTVWFDYVRTQVQCGADNSEYCPDGGVFSEGFGCVLGDHVRPSPCQPADGRCVAGGEVEGARCRLWTFEFGDLNGTIPSYWVQRDPAGVYYRGSGGTCHYGGVWDGEFCRLMDLDEDLLEAGVDYVVDRSATPTGIFYTPDFRQ